MRTHVAFNDAVEEEIIASFGCEQDTDVWIHQGVVEGTDKRWVSYIAQFPISENVESVAN